MVGEIVHIELPSRDFVRSSTFYGKLFGWKTDGVQSGGHLLFELPGGVRGSWIRDALAQAPGPVPFVAVADVDKTLTEAEKQGGRILVQRMALPNRGVFGLFADCDGNVVGVLTSTDVAATSDSGSISISAAPSAAVSAKETRKAELSPAAKVEKPAKTKATEKAPAKKAPARKK